MILPHGSLARVRRGCANARYRVYDTCARCKDGVVCGAWEPGNWSLLSVFILPGWAAGLGSCMVCRCGYICWMLDDRIG